MGLLEKFVHLYIHDPQSPLYMEKFTILYLPKGLIEWAKKLPTSEVRLTVFWSNLQLGITSP